MPNSKSTAKSKQIRKKDALALAELIYDMYKEEERQKAILKEGQSKE